MDSGKVSTSLAAMLATAASRSASGTTSLTRPQSSAVFASTHSQSISICRARPSPPPPDHPLRPRAPVAQADGQPLRGAAGGDAADLHAALPEPRALGGDG